MIALSRDELKRKNYLQSRVGNFCPSTEGYPTITFPEGREDFASAVLDHLDEGDFRYNFSMTEGGYTFVIFNQLDDYLARMHQKASEATWSPVY